MTQAKLNEIAARLKDQGKTRKEIWVALVDTKGSRCTQIAKALASIGF
jgi:hypothetical protein